MEEAVFAKDMRLIRQMSDVRKHKDTDAGSFVAFVGVMLLMTGLYGYSRFLAISVTSPYTLTGATCYIVGGIYLSLSFSSALRMSLLQALPTSLLRLLYKKSLIEVVEELTHPVRKPKQKVIQSIKKQHRPNPLIKGYELLALSATLDHGEIEELSEALPHECDFMKKPGLINFLPKPLRAMLRGDHIVDDIIHMREQQKAARAFIESTNIDAAANGFFAMPQNMRVENTSSPADSGSAATATSVGVNTATSPATQVVQTKNELESEPEQDDHVFEAALQRAIKKHLQKAIQKTVNGVTKKVVATSYYVSSGGRIPGSWLSATFAVCASAFIGTRLKLGSKLVESSGGQLIGSWMSTRGLGSVLKLGSLLFSGLFVGVKSWGCLAGTTSGTMLLVRRLFPRTVSNHGVVTGSDAQKTDEATSAEKSLAAGNRAFANIT